jgi:hypothetical protein
MAKSAEEMPGQAWRDGLRRRRDQTQETTIGLKKGFDRE